MQENRQQLSVYSYHYNCHHADLVTATTSQNNYRACTATSASALPSAASAATAAEIQASKAALP